MNNINSSGFLDVGDGHQLYFEDWGNPDGIPIIHNHGGPGNGFSDQHKALYDPKIHHVIFHDQRGAGRSTPFASTENNTTLDLIDDIEFICEHFGLDTVYIAGGSWGSALSLCYAIAHPERIKGILVWGVYLISEFEEDWVNEGYPRYHFPAEWKRFITLVPHEHRTRGKSIMGYYAEQMRSSDKNVANKYAIEWTLWESTLITINYDPAQNMKEVLEDPNTLSVALFETHYFMNNCFLPRGHIFNNIETIKHIPISIVQGRFDMCTPAVSAYNLFNAYGENATLQWVNSGHLRADPEMLPALQETIKTAFI